MDVSEHVWHPLGQLLVAQGVVSAHDLEAALTEQKRSGERLGEILIARGYASRIAIVDALAQQAGLLLEPETGFGAGLREQLERRYRRSGELGINAAETVRRTTELDSPTLSSAELQATLLDRAHQTVDPDATGLEEARADGLGTGADDDFLAVVARARSHVAARRAELAKLRPRGARP
jgi:hypothetical protein